MNKPLFESLSVTLAEVPSEYSGLLRIRKEKLIEDLAQLMEEDEEFFDSISVGTQTTRQVKIRFTRMREMVQEVLS